MRIATISGTILAMVTTVLMKVASLTPRRIMKWNAQTPMSDTMIEVALVPSPKISGKNRPSVELISTQ